MFGLQIAEAQLRRNLPDEGHLLADLVNTQHGCLRFRDRQDHAGQSRPTADVHDARGHGLANDPPNRRHDSEAVGQVLREHVRQLAHRREVVGRIPALQQMQIVQQGIELGTRQVQAEFGDGLY